MKGVPELNLQSDLDDGAEGLRHAVDLGVPVVLSKGKDTARGKLPEGLQLRFPKRVTFTFGESGWNSTIDDADASTR